MPRKRLSSSSSASGARFQLSARAVEGGLLDLRLVAKGGDVDASVDVEIEVERITCITREFIESMGGDAPYDRFELRWPLETDSTLTELLALQTAQDEAQERLGTDALLFLLPEPLDYPALMSDENAPDAQLSQYSAVTSFFAWDEGVFCQIGNSTFRFRTAQCGFLSKPGPHEDPAIRFEACSLLELQEALETRNSSLGLAPPSLSPQAPQKAPKNTALERKREEFPVHTGEEWTAFMQAAADGKTMAHFVGNDQSGILRHQRPNAAFFTETTLLEEERRAGHGIELLQNAAAQLDIDDGLAWLYISHLLAPPSPLAPNAYAGGWIDLDDVARKTMGGYAHTPQEMEERRAKVWQAIRYGARAHIGGKRSVPYFDKNSGQEIETEIYTSPWQILSRQKIAQLPLFAHGEEEAPLRVELVASREWTALTTDASTAQYLPFGEILGALPAKQVGGAWARVLGLAYINWCRRRVGQALEGEKLPARREMLDAFPSKVGPYRAILESKDPRRALGYWQTAEILLRDAEIIETEANLYEPPSRKNWQEAWLDGSPDWKPGALLKPILEEISKKQFPIATKLLKKSVRPRRKKRDFPVQN